MSILNFSEFKYIKSFDDDEEVRLGNFMTQEPGLLGKIRANIYIQDFTALSGSESMTMKIYSGIDYANILYTSDVALLSDIAFDTTDPTKENFLGYLRFDFNSDSVNANIKYYPTITISNYTRVGDIFYSGLAYDYPDPVYDNASLVFFEHPIAMQVYTNRVRTV